MAGRRNADGPRYGCDQDPLPLPGHPGGGNDRVKGTLAAVWGLLGVFLLIGTALSRLVPVGLDALALPLGPIHWLALALWLPFMAWTEGYRGFHRSFSPMVAARARHLRDHPRSLHAALAPLVCMGFVHATRRRKVRSGALTLGIIVLVILVRRLDQPWRGIIDLGVALGLALGLCSLAYFAARALGEDAFDHPPEVPDEGGWPPEGGG